MMNECNNEESYIKENYHKASGEEKSYKLVDTINSIDQLERRFP